MVSQVKTNSPYIDQTYVKELKQAGWLNVVNLLKTQRELMCVDFIKNIPQKARERKADNLVTLMDNAYSRDETPNQFDFVIRMKYYDSFKKIVELITSNYFKNQDKGPILELGAGRPCFGSQSYLSSCLPETIQAQVTLSDYCPNFAKPIENRKSNYKTFDSCKIAYKDKEFASVISCCFMDVLTQSKLQQTLLEIKRVLRDTEGYVIHFSDQEPFSNTFIHQFSNQNILAFPLTDSQALFAGLHIIKQNDYQNILRQQLQDENRDLEVEFLDWYCSLKPIQREFFLTYLKDTHKGFLFSAWIESIIPEKYRKSVMNEKTFEEKLIKSTEAAGFEILQVGYHTKEKLKENETPQIKKLKGNVITHKRIKDRFTPFTSNDPTLPEGVLKIITTVHVMVARKTVS
jgi:hypothetical protein